MRKPPFSVLDVLVYLVKPQICCVPSGMVVF